MISNNNNDNFEKILVIIIILTKIMNRLTNIMKAIMIKT